MGNFSRVRGGEYNMFLSLFLCQIMRADDDAQQSHAHVIHVELPKTPQCYYEERHSNFIEVADNSMGWFTGYVTCQFSSFFRRRPTSSVDFHSIITSELKKAQQAATAPNVKHYINTLSDWFEKVDLKAATVSTHEYLGWCKKEKIEQRPDYQQRESQRGWRRTFANFSLHNLGQDIYLKCPEFSVNGQIIDDLRVLTLMIDLEHARLTHNREDTEFLLWVLRDQLRSNLRTSTMDACKLWFAFIEQNNPHIKSLPEWKEIETRIWHPQIDTAYFFGRFLRNAVVNFVLAGVIIYYCYHIYHSGLINFFGGNSDGRSVPNNPVHAMVSAVSAPQHYEHRHLYVQEITASVLSAFADGILGKGNLTAALPLLWHLRFNSGDPMCFPEQHAALTAFGDFLTQQGRALLGGEPITCSVQPSTSGHEILGVTCNNPSSLVPSSHDPDSETRIVTQNGEECSMHPAEHEPGHMELRVYKDGDFAVSVHPFRDPAPTDAPVPPSPAPEMPVPPTPVPETPVPPTPPPLMDFPLEGTCGVQHRVWPGFENVTMPQGCVCVDAPQVGTNATLLDASQVSIYFGNLSAVQSMMADLSGQTFSALVTFLNQTRGAGLSAPLQSALSSAIEWRRCNGTFSVPQAIASKYDTFQKVCSQLEYDCGTFGCTNADAFCSTFFADAPTNRIPKEVVFSQSLPVLDLYLLAYELVRGLNNDTHIFPSPVMLYGRGLHRYQVSYKGVAKRMFDAKNVNRGVETFCPNSLICLPSKLPEVQIATSYPNVPFPADDISFPLYYPPIARYP
jgi:hypothetical protein